MKKSARKLISVMLTVVLLVTLFGVIQLQTAAGGAYDMNVGETKTIWLVTGETVSRALWSSNSSSVGFVRTPNASYAEIQVLSYSSLDPVISCTYYYYTSGVGGTTHYVKGYDSWRIHINQPTLTITFEPRNGGSSFTQSILSGESIGTLTQPTYSGHSFQGWYTQQTGGRKVSASDTFTADTTLYAAWDYAPDPGPSGEDEAGYTYTSATGGVMITGYTGENTDLVIPSSIGGQTVVSIGNKAFYQNDKITSVKIPDTVHTIYSYTFQDCTSLQELELGQGLTKICTYAFAGCTALSSPLVIPDSVTTLDTYAFYNCSSIPSVKLSASLTSITAYAFRSCTSLSGELVIPNNVRNINNYAFYNCPMITDVVIGRNISSIGSNAFALCNSLTHFTVPQNCSISSYAFKQSGLETVSFPDENIGTINTNAFDDTPWSDSVSIEPGACYIDNFFFKWIGDVPERVEVRDGVTWINGEIFLNNAQLKELSIPASVKFVGSNLCKGCTTLETVELEDGIEKIGTGAFMNCTALKSITIPGSVTGMGQDLCNGCTALKSAQLLPGVTSTEKNAFKGCTALQTVSLPDSLLSIGAYSFYSCKSIASIHIPYGVKNIYMEAFEACTGLKTLTIPGSVVSIGSYAFNNSGLTSVTLEPGIRTIGSSAFSYCTGLTTFKVPSTVTSIGDYAFQQSTGLKTVYFPPSLQTFGGDKIFDGVYNVTVKCASGTPGYTYPMRNRIPYSYYTFNITGDANNDGIVEISDVTNIQRVLAALDVNATVSKRGDLSGNGLDIFDATMIQRFLARFENPYMIGDY